MDSHSRHQDNQPTRPAHLSGHCQGERVTSSHPASWESKQLLAACDSKRQKRSGPGGQHRNKVETAVVLTHRASQIQGQASERRSQHENRQVALFRLRLNLAVGLRSDDSPMRSSELWQQRCRAKRISISPTHQDFPVLLAEVLDFCQATGGDLKTVAKQLETTISQLIRFLKLEPRAFQLLNQLRVDNHLHPLK